MAIHDLKSGKKIYDFKLDVGSISTVSGKYFHNEMFFSFCSFLTPNIIHKVEFEGDKISESVRNGFKICYDAIYVFIF